MTVRPLFLASCLPFVLAGLAPAQVPSEGPRTWPAPDAQLDRRHVGERYYLHGDLTSPTVVNDVSWGWVKVAIRGEGAQAVYEVAQEERGRTHDGGLLLLSRKMLVAPNMVLLAKDEVKQIDQARYVSTFRWRLDQRAYDVGYQRPRDKTPFSVPVERELVVDDLHVLFPAVLMTAPEAGVKLWIASDGNVRSDICNFKLKSTEPNGDRIVNYGYDAKGAGFTATIASDGRLVRTRSVSYYGIDVVDRAAIVARFGANGPPEELPAVDLETPAFDPPPQPAPAARGGRDGGDRAPAPAPAAAVPEPADVVAEVFAAIARGDEAAVLARWDVKRTMLTEAYGARPSKKDRTDFEALWARDGEKLAGGFISAIVQASVKTSGRVPNAQAATYRPHCQQKIRRDKAIVVISMPRSTPYAYSLERENDDGPWRIVDKPRDAR